MEKIRSEIPAPHGFATIECYRATEVDAMLHDVRRLVEAARRVIKISDRNHDAWDDAKQAISAVERHFSSKTSQP